jgi:DNA polymerase-3 subunit alpha
VLPPDVNESGYKFTVIGDRRMRFGLGAIRNVGRGAIDSILAARKQKPIESIFDLCSRIDLRLCNKRVIEALVAAGALDGLNGHRAQFFSILDTAIQEASLEQEEKAVGQGSLFGEAGGTSHGHGIVTRGVLPNVGQLSESERLTKEKEILGFYISGHPLEPFRSEYELFATHTVAQLGSWSDQQMVLGVVITSVKKQVSKRSGAEFARLTVEDFSGSSEVLVFPENWASLAGRVRTDVPVLLKGGYSQRDQAGENPTFIVESLQPFTELRLNGNLAVAIDLKPGGDAVAAEVMRDVRAVVEAHPGSSPLVLRWSDENGGQARLRSRTLKLAATNAALTDLRMLLGQERVRLVRGS